VVVSHRYQEPGWGVPDGGVPEGGVPDGTVPSPAGGVPDGRVPFICIPSGGVPEGAPADWLNLGLSPLLVASVVPDDEPVAGGSAEAVFVICACEDAEVLPDWAVVLPESCVQPAMRIPAMRIADATSIIILLFFMEFISRNITRLIVPFPFG
jgi:hypothetical protein